MRIQTQAIVQKQNKKEVFKALNDANYLTIAQMKEIQGGESTTKKMDNFLYHNNTLETMTGM